MRFETDEGALEVEISRLIIAGWTGRDEAGVRHHIEELANIGVPAPSAIPLYYRGAANLLTQDDAVEVLGDATSGEAEPLIMKTDGALWLGLGSDHTDRGLEAHSVAHSKQICAKPVASALWRLDGIADLDAVELRAEIHEKGEWIAYQEGTLAAIRPLAELIEGAALADGEAMLCGTLSAIGGVRAAARFRMELRDPATGRAISHEYEAKALPVIS
ncbi:MAG: DUF2848 domain-containing protein [Pseudomonadota bacterium]